MIEDPLAVTDEDMATSWASPSRIAQDLLGCILATLACTPWGGPEGCDEDEAVRLVSPTPSLSTACCGGVVVAVRRMFWHIGDLSEIRSYAPVLETYKGGDALQLGVEISAAVLRTVPEIGSWGGLPILGNNPIVGDIDDEILTDSATVLASDQLAMMVAQQACFEGEPGTEVARGHHRRVWTPAPVERLHYAHNCMANIIGWGRTTPIRVNLSDAPCVADCVELGAIIEG